MAERQMMYLRELVSGMEERGLDEMRLSGVPETEGEYVPEWRAEVCRYLLLGNADVSIATIRRWASQPWAARMKINVYFDP